MARAGELLVGRVEVHVAAEVGALGGERNDVVALATQVDDALDVLDEGAVLASILDAERPDTIARDLRERQRHDLDRVGAFAGSNDDPGGK